MSILPLSPNELGKDTVGVGSLGISLQLLVGPAPGPAVLMPAPNEIIQAIRSVEIVNTDSGRDGFQITFSIGRGKEDVSDYPIFNMLNSLFILRPFTRIIIIANIGLRRRVLIDGFITQHQFNNSASMPGKSTLSITGEDYSVVMDMYELPVIYPNLPDYVIVNLILLRYGLIPAVIPPPQIFTPLAIDNDPVQTDTDLKYILQLANKYHFIFYIEPTDIPGVNKAYWRPPIQIGIPQKAITVSMGSGTNCYDIQFQNNALKPKSVYGIVQDRLAQNIIAPVIVPAPLPPFLSARPAHLFNAPFVRTKIFNSKGDDTIAQAYINAVSDVDKSREVVSASGVLNTLHYGEILRARGLVSLRGVGNTYDGLYYVKSVTHKIELGSYKQKFILTREGVGSIISGVKT